jgi:succinate-semialdehyde dehydrogenase/glutarate-semialdehyde dehydrogenase
MTIQNFKLFRDKCYINGEWIEANSKDTISVNNPATLKEIGTVPKCGKEETKKAIDAANVAWPKWKSTSAKERSIILRKWFDLIISNKEELAQIMTIEQGKPINESRGEIVYGASFIEWFAEEAKRVYGDTIPDPLTDRRIVVLKQPVGVVASITPWNFPNAMITRKCAPALAVGCPVVIKPASQTPYSALALAASS